jgi:hypothetical protein
MTKTHALNTQRTKRPFTHRSRILTVLSHRDQILAAIDISHSEFERTSCGHHSPASSPRPRRISTQPNRGTNCGPNALERGVGRIRDDQGTMGAPNGTNLSRWCRIVPLAITIPGTHFNEASTASIMLPDTRMHLKRDRRSIWLSRTAHMVDIGGGVAAFAGSWGALETMEAILEQ